MVQNDLTIRFVVNTIIMFVIQCDVYQRLCARAVSISFRLHAKLCVKAAIRPSRYIILKVNAFIEFSTALEIEYVKVVSMYQFNKIYSLASQLMYYHCQLALNL